MSINTLIFASGLLLLIGIGSSKFSARLGMPVLVLFLGVGMLAGSDGIGGIEFSDFALANSIATVALAIILFDGGLQTTTESVRAVWKPALTLATFGVALTSAVTGAVAAWVLGIPILHGMLLGSIVGSTDAAAVFSVLRTSGLKLPSRLTATLEVESASNDPMAIFLTVGLIEVISQGVGSPISMLMLFVEQFGIGAIAGLAVGRIGAWAVNKINLDYPGLYPVLVTSFGLLAFGLAAVLGGSGFLAIYIAGVALAAGNIVFERGIFSFHETAAWLSQIILFVMLGLLSFPARLINVIGEGLIISVALIFIARPLTILLCATPFKFNFKESAFLNWVGLKGAVPITLATFPLVAGVPNSELIFDVVFFVVLVSAISQGWSLSPVARWLGLGEPSDPVVPLSIEINALRHVDGEIIEYIVAPSARVAGQALRDLALPDGVVMTIVVRDKEVIMPRGGTNLRPGDHVFIAMRKSLKPLMDRLFDPYAETPPLPDGLQLAFHQDSTIGQLHRFFGIPGPTWSKERVGTLLAPEQEDPKARLGPFIVSRAAEHDFVLLTKSRQPESESASEPS